MAAAAGGGEGFVNSPGRGRARQVARRQRACGGPQPNISKRQQQERHHICHKYTRLADTVSSLAAELAFRLALRAQVERSARAACRATDALQLAEAAHRLADAIALDRQVAA